MSQLEVFVGGQYGSEGKGAVAAWRAKQIDGPLLSIRVAGPNAGHTVIGQWGVDTSESMIAPHLCEPLDGQEFFTPGARHDGRFAWRLRCVPVAAVVNPTAMLALAPGSEIDLDVLIDEVQALDRAGYEVSERLLIDSQATVLMQRHKDQEAAGGMLSWSQHELVRLGRADVADLDSQSLTERQGSTGKGIGAARAERLWRIEDVCLQNNREATDRLIEAGIDTVGYQGVGGIASLAANRLATPDAVVHVEGTQGYGLGLHSGMYPYGTSSDCRAIDFLAMAGISPWKAGLNGLGQPNTRLTVWVCVRPHPIRVAGNSGPMKGETTWEALGLPEEITTVTRKTRRVGEWDADLVKQAIAGNGGPSPSVRLAFTMFDQVVPELAGCTETTVDWHLAQEAQERVNRYLSTLSPFAVDVGYLGTGPDTGIGLS